MPRNLSFPKGRRLIYTADFARVRDEGRKVRGPLLSLAVLATGKGEKMRVGFITSKRIGGAVVRNRVRRRLRDIVRRHQHEIVDGHWLVVIAGPAAARASYADLEAEWLRLATRTSILAP
ncbi:MAG: ribonuclease P protein component [Spartobacteria bacterium]